MDELQEGLTDEKQKRWRAFALTLLVTAGLLFPALTTALYVIDPYGTGRARLIDPPGVRAQGTRTEHANRALDPAFDAVILGNSRMQALSPERLTTLTGARFASLTVPGTRPREQLTLLDWFLRHRETPPAAVLIGTDIFWCRGGDEALATVNPFPFWLYDENIFVYLRGLVRFNVLQEGVRRIEYALERRDRARPDGYWDYDPIYESQGYDREDKRALLMEYKPEDLVNESGVFPAIEELGARLVSLPTETVVGLVIPPAFITGQPRADTPEGRTELACREALETLARSRPRTFVIGWSGALPETTNPDDYFDHVHYKRALARVLEDQLAGRMNAFRDGQQVP